MTETLSADIVCPSPRTHDLVHGISHTRLRNRRARRVRPRMVRNSQRRGGSSGGAAHAPPLHPPLRRRRECLLPPPTPALQRPDRNPGASRDRLQAHAATQSQRAHQKEQGTHIEAPPEEANRRWRLTSPARCATEAETPDIAAQCDRQTVRLARIPGTVKNAAAARTARRTAGLRLGRVNMRQEQPDARIGEHGASGQRVRHWTRPVV